MENPGRPTQLGRSHSQGGTSMTNPPKMSELRLVLLGKNSSEISRVGNVILGRDAFDTEAPPPSGQQHSERASGNVGGRYITLINTPHLFDPQISVADLTERVKECVPLCAPGPHAFLLVLPSDNFTKQDQNRTKNILRTFSTLALQYSVLLTIGEDHGLSFYLSLFVSDCNVRQHVFENISEVDNHQVLQLLEKIEEMVKQNGGEHLTSETDQSLEVESTAEKHSAAPGRGHAEKEHRIVLFGKNSSEISRVGNFILGRDVFDTEGPPPSVEQHSERASGKVEGRYITLINTPHLFSPPVSEMDLTQRLKECMSLCAPGPHVTMLVLQPDDFNETDRNQVHVILKHLSGDSQKYTLVLTTPRLPLDTEVAADQVEESVSQLITDFSNRHFEFGSECSHSALVEMMNNIVEENEGTHLKWEIKEDDPPAREQKQHKQTVKRKKTMSLKHEPQKFTEAQKFTEKLSQRLNLVLCGSNRVLKSPISDLILGQREHSPEPSSVCVKREGEVCGRLITLVEIPALYNTQLSEEKVMQETLQCVSLCDSGVHAFLLIIPEGQVTDEDNGEMEKILRIFSSKVSDHLIVLFTMENAAMDVIEHIKKTKSSVAIYGQKYRILEMKVGKNPKQVPELLDEIEKTMKTNPYSLDMYTKGQEEKIQQDPKDTHRKELSEMEKKTLELKGKIQLEGYEDELLDLRCLRMILIGRTGSGKSATGNTILGRDEFVSEASLDSVTKVCNKRVGEVQGKSVTVVDTPGLFDTTLSNEEIQEEIVKCISMSAPGPHAFLIVMSLGRITQEEVDPLRLIKTVFGPKAAMFSIVLFTGGDELGNQPISQYIEKCKNEQIKKLLRDCGNRFVVFNNREREDHTQVSELLRQIQTMVKSYTDQYFTNSMFQESEMSIKKKMEEILKEREKEIKAEKEKMEEILKEREKEIKAEKEKMEEILKEREKEIKAEKEKMEAQYISIMKEMKKRLEEEKIKSGEEKQQMERKFTEKLEALQKEFEEKNEIEKEKRETDDKATSEDEKKQMEKWHQKLKEVEIKNNKQRATFEKQLKERDEEDKKREERYKQDIEKLRNEQKHTMEELIKTQKEELQRRASEEHRRRKEEEEERQRWERKIKEAEHERKEIQEELKQKQKEWEEEKKRQLKKREEEDRLRKQRHAEELRAKQEEQERTREKFEKEIEYERRRREEEKHQWMEAMRKESERKEREYEEMKGLMEIERKKQQVELEQMRRKLWEKRKHEDDERREEEIKKLQKIVEEIEREWQEKNKRREKEWEEENKSREREREEENKRREREWQEENKRREEREREQQEENKRREEREREWQEENKRREREWQEESKRRQEREREWQEENNRRERERQEENKRREEREREWQEENKRRERERQEENKRRERERQEENKRREEREREWQEENNRRERERQEENKRRERERQEENKRREREQQEENKRRERERQEENKRREERERERQEENNRRERERQEEYKRREREQEKENKRREREQEEFNRRQQEERRRQEQDKSCVIL